MAIKQQTVHEIAIDFISMTLSTMSADHCPLSLLKIFLLGVTCHYQMPIETHLYPFRLQMPYYSFFNGNLNILLPALKSMASTSTNCVSGSSSIKLDHFLLRTRVKAVLKTSLRPPTIQQRLTWNEGSYFHNSFIQTTVNHTVPLNPWYYLIIRLQGILWQHSITDLYQSQELRGRMNIHRQKCPGSFFIHISSETVED